MVLISREKMGVDAASVGAGFHFLMPLCAWAVYGETLTGLQRFGIALLTAGVVFVSLGHLLGKCGRTPPGRGAEAINIASLSLWQLAPVCLRDFNQGFDADQPSLVVLEPSGGIFPPCHKRVHPLAQEHDILAVLDHFGDETQETAGGAKSSATPRASSGCASNHARVSATT